MNDKVEEGRVCENFGSIYYRMDDFVSVKIWYRVFYKIVEDIEDMVEMGKVENYFSNICSCIGVYEEVILYYCCDLSIVREEGDKLGEGVVYGNFGSIYFN